MRQPRQARRSSAIPRNTRPPPVEVSRPGAVLQPEPPDAFGWHQNSAPSGRQASQVKPRKRGIGRNPRTGKEVRIPPGRTIRFKPGKDLQNIGG